MNPQFMKPNDNSDFPGMQTNGNNMLPMKNNNFHQGNNTQFTPQQNSSLNSQMFPPSSNQKLPPNNSPQSNLSQQNTMQQQNLNSPHMPPPLSQKYPSNKTSPLLSQQTDIKRPQGYPTGMKQPGLPLQTNYPAQQSHNSQSGFTPQPIQPGFPPHSNQKGFPPQPNQGFPPQPNQQGFPSQPNQQGFPPQQKQQEFSSQPNKQGFPSQPNPQGFPPQQKQQEFSSQTNKQGFAPQPNPQGFTAQPNPQGFPPQPNPQGFPPQPNQQGFPPQPNQQGFPPQPNQQGFPPQPNQQGFPPQLNQQGFPPQPNQQGFSPQPNQQGFSPQPNQQGFPPQPNQQVFPPQPNQQGFPPHPNHQSLPGQQVGYPAYPQSPTVGYPQQQQQRRLDPDQMPSPIQVMQDDQKTRSGIFYTNQKGQTPPLVTTEFITHDQGNAAPKYMRSTIYSVPITGEILKQSQLPFSLVISPFANLIHEEEFPPPVVDFGELGPVRCIRCKAYMCPFMQFIDSGKRFQCTFCQALTEVPAEYFQHLDHTGQRIDRYDRPELILGTYELIATKEYCRNNVFPKTPAIIFVIDVSYNNIKSGLVPLLCGEMKQILKNLPVDQNQDKSVMKVGFITYSNTVHFYNIKGNLAQPQTLVVGDVQDMFMPLLDGFLCDVEESEQVIDLLMEQIPKIFCQTRETETILAPAIQAGLEALIASDCVGKLLVFHSTLPIYEAPGKLKNRDDRKLLGTDKEKNVLTPQNNVYNNLAQSCVQAGCSVDLFIMNNSYIDLATIGQVARLTGGQIYKYTYFQADIDGFRLINDLIDILKRPIGFDAVMRVRTSTGVRPTDFYGHFFMSNTTDIELASIDSEKAIAIEIKHDDKLNDDDTVYIQAALLYTSCSGQRRLRIINLSLKTCSQYADLYRYCDLDTIMNYYSKQYTFKLLESTPKQIKESLTQRCAQTLACYRKQCASPSSAGQLILPECMKLMPLYLNCLLKNDIISGGPDMHIDDRSFLMYRAMIMNVFTSVSFFYPRVMPVHDLDISSEATENKVPQQIRCSYEKLADNGAYILENGIYIFLWLGTNISNDWLQNVFGVPTIEQVKTDIFQLPVINNPLSIRLRALIDVLRKQKHNWMRLTILRQHDKLENVFKHYLVEDHGIDGSSSYVDFLCYLHKEIRTILS